MSTPLLDILCFHLPGNISSVELVKQSSPQSRSAIETLLTFALGGDCPKHLSEAHPEWLRTQPVALKALQESLGTQGGTKRALDNKDTDDLNSKRQKMAEDEDDQPLFTLPSISTTSPVRKKVDVTVHKRSIRFVHPTTRVLESSVPLASIARAFLLPTRGKTKGHWTVVLLPTDVPDKAKVSPLSAQQIIFGLDAISAAPFEVTSYSSGTTAGSTVPIAKGEETETHVLRLLSHIPVPLLEPSASVFRSACATAKSGDGAAGIDAYLSAKSGTLWFFDSGILWGESKPCEFWAISDLLPRDGVRLISATGRTCTVILSRKRASSTEPGSGDIEGEDAVETAFSMVDGREQDPIQAWVRDRKHLFGIPRVGSGPVSQTKNSLRKVQPEYPQLNGTVRGPAWDDSDPDDEDFEASSSENLESSSSDEEESEDGSGPGSESGSQSEGEDNGESESEEEAQEAHHPLLQPGAMPRVSKAAMAMVVDLVCDSEEDELEE